MFKTGNILCSFEYIPHCNGICCDFIPAPAEKKLSRQLISQWRNDATIIIRMVEYTSWQTNLANIIIKRKILPDSDNMQMPSAGMTKRLPSTQRMLIFPIPDPLQKVSLISYRNLCQWRCENVHLWRNESVQLTTFMHMRKGCGNAETGGLFHDTRFASPGIEHQSNIAEDRTSP